jgi:polyisoprenoid-binding protein YceI
VLAGRATVKRLDFGIGAGDWADTAMLPDEIAVSTRVRFVPAP